MADRTGGLAGSKDGAMCRFPHVFQELRLGHTGVAEHQDIDVPRIHCLLLMSFDTPPKRLRAKVVLMSLSP